jgi:hypothetical protein
MQQDRKKAIERRYAEAFIAGRVECRCIDDSEKPDFWVRRENAPDIGLEVTEYHPTADEVDGIQRREIESRWRDSLEPKLDSLRKRNPELRNTYVRFQFVDPKVPRKKEHDALAAEFTNLVTAVVAAWPDGAREINLDFASRAEANMCNSVSASSGWTFLPKEDWLNCSRHLHSITLQHLDVAWITPRPSEFKRILEDKASAARKYDLEDQPLWLLIVVDLPGDTKSQLALQSDEDVKELFATTGRSGFDFENSPFKEVWLLSALFAWNLRLYPAGAASAISR